VARALKAQVGVELAIELSRGQFYEGIIANGVTSAATDEAIQANIVAVGYKTLPTAHVPL
jgi:hypothetical protein